jgi:hypothetical protein
VVRGAPHARILRLPGDEVVDPDPETAGEGDEQFQRRLAFARLEPRQRARRHARVAGELLQRQARRLSGRAQDRAHLFHIALHHHSLLFQQKCLLERF